RLLATSKPRVGRTGQAEVRHCASSAPSVREVGLGSLLSQDSRSPNSSFPVDSRVRAVSVPPKKPQMPVPPSPRLRHIQHSNMPRRPMRHLVSLYPALL